MNEIRYEVNWHEVDDHFDKVTVTPIRVIREGVLPGCTGVSITAIGSDGHRFLGSPGDYFNTEAEAWGQVRRDIEYAIADSEAQCRLASDERQRWSEFLKSIERNAP